MKKLFVSIFIIFSALSSIVFGGGTDESHAEYLAMSYGTYANAKGAINSLAVNYELDDVEAIAALPSYDSRDYGLVTPVKDQGDSDLCWAYASISASETSILKSGIDPKATADNLSLSPEALGYSRFTRPSDPLGNTKAFIDPSGSNWYNSAGTAQYSATIMSQWCGPTNKSQSANVNPFENALYHLDNAIHINSKSISDIKLAIAEYGAVTFSYNNLRETEYYNPKYETSASSYPHACTLIGWNDDIPAENFKPNGAGQNGGWLVKNSYLSLPYFWLSYDNSSDSVYAFDFTAKNTYDNNYFYDNSLSDSLNYSINAKKACEIFESKSGSTDKTEYLKAVNVGFIGKNVTVSVDIYAYLTDESNPESGIRVGGGQASFKYGGFRTVNLDAPIKLKNGEKFACVVSVINPENSAVICNMLGKNGTPSFIFKNYWQSANNCTPRIKAFTAIEQNDEPLPHVHTLVPDNGKAATCTQDGVYPHEHCSGCNKDFIDGAEKTKEELKIKALGHSITHHAAIVATCTQKGCDEYETCSRCNYSTYTEIPPLGHDYGEWTVTKQPTLEECGEERRVCSRNGAHIETRQLPKLNPPPETPDDGGDEKDDNGGETNDGGGEKDDSGGETNDNTAPPPAQPSPSEKQFNPLWLIPIVGISIAAISGAGLLFYKLLRKNKTK